MFAKWGHNESVAPFQNISDFIMRLGCLVALMLVMPLSFPVSADEVVISRYLSASKDKLNAAVMPLDEMITVRVPLEIKTIGEAMEYILQGSGYQLKKEPDLVLYQHAYPRVYRSIGGVELRAVLKNLAGAPYQLVVDPVNRLISFRLHGVYSAWN